MCGKMVEPATKSKPPGKSKHASAKSGHKGASASISELNGEDISRENGGGDRSHHAVAAPPRQEDVVEAKMKKDEPEILGYENGMVAAVAQRVEPVMENGAAHHKTLVQSQPVTAASPTGGYIKTQQIRNMSQQAFGLPPGAYYDAASIPEFYRFAQPPTFMDGYPIAPTYAASQPMPAPSVKSGSDALARMYMEFCEKYARGPYRKAHTHAIIAYHIYASQASKHAAATARTASVTTDRKISGGYGKIPVDRCMNPNGRLLNMPTYP